MASINGVERPPILPTIILLVLVVVVGFIAAQWIVGIVLGLIRLALIILALYLIARVAWYLLKKGGSKSSEVSL